ncbi:MFS transporter [Telmatospirillum sp.]|uniref:MFS transporter n=1 Tax=Telmatospirillum sp. TaxID=2079197 RepID=UPI00284E8A64|nr:MFS transporter [Telmatospirillum sp.]MDR3440166.1 MFS transporter [Telmatospirillum sp.]
MTTAAIAHFRGKPPSSILLAAILAAFLAASSVPVPLYRLYQQAWGFSPFLLTVIFAVYALALLTALLLFGSLADKIGRKPVILAALGLEIVVIILFLCASDVGWLVTARLIQGFATGLATSALGAALLDIDRERGALINSVVPMLGMGAGALGSGLLAAFAVAPLRLVFALLLAILLLQFVLMIRSPETAHSLSSGRWSPRPRIAIPVQARAELLAVTPVNVALWALGGFYLSLMPSLIATAIGSAPIWLGGLAVAALTTSGAAAILLGRQRPPLTMLMAGAGVLTVGLVVILAGANFGSLVLLLLGPVIAGAGFGGAFLGALRSVLPLAEPQERAGLMAAFYVESYLANALPVVVAGVFVKTSGLLATANVFGGAVILLALLALGLAVLRHRRRHAVCVPVPSFD